MCVGCYSAYAAMAADESLAQDTRQWAITRTAAFIPQITSTPSGTAAITLKVPAAKADTAKFRQPKGALNAI